jgi:hypothetical protein
MVERYYEGGKEIKIVIERVEETIDEAIKK